MELDLEVCRAIAVQHGLPLQFVAKEFHVFNVLGQITEFSMDIKTAFVFKGGTALNKVYLKKGQRFSEDLDFDLDVRTDAELLKFCKEMSIAIKGYKIGKIRKVRDTLQFDCAYETPFGSVDHIRIDISKKNIFTALPLQKKPATSDFAQLSASGFDVYSLEDLVARKMHALATRTEGKDIYDVHSSIPLCGDMRNPILFMLRSEKKTDEPKEFVHETLVVLDKVDIKKIASLTNPFIPLRHRPKNWLELKNNLILMLERLKI